MSAPAIRVERLGKRYQIGAVQQREDTLRDSLMASLSAPAGWWRRPRVEAGEWIWALREISFEVQQGEVVGIIGRNGAGKSTLLRILSRITRPTEGFAELRGQVGSLLEVGTGFHPELTGRENIYLNGAILGMRRSHIKQKFDEIVAFAEIEKFIDTPVKRYSSGMYVRLAFAVAAHLEPEVLVVDEVLAVGDALFQKKCLGKLQDVAVEGRTVLFVSHNISALLELCQSGIVLDGGRVTKRGSIADATDFYLRSLSTAGSPTRDLSAVPRTNRLHLRGRALLLSAAATSAGEAGMIRYGAPLAFEFTLQVLQTLESLELGVGVFVASGTEVCSILSSDDRPWRDVVPGVYRARIELPALRLMPNVYELGLGLRSHEGVEDYVKGAVTFEITASGQAAADRTHLRKGLVVPAIHASLELEAAVPASIGPSV